MKKIRLIAAVAIAGAFTLLSSGPAQAYPDTPVITITVPDSTLVGGETFTYTVDAGTVDCDWTITYDEGRADGESATQTGNGTSFSGSYKTKVVTKKFTSPIKAVCKYDDTKVVSANVVTSNQVTPAFYSASSNNVVQAADAFANASAVITLLPRGGSGDDDGDDNGILPDTGGSSLYIVVIGAALVLAGGGAAYAARRRH